MDQLNLIISLFALVVAIGTAVFSHFYYAKSEQNRRREIVLDAINAAQECEVLLHNVERERRKTGADLKEGEIELFKNLNNGFNSISTLSDILICAVSTNKNIPPELAEKARLLKHHVAGLSCSLEMLLAKFVNFNNNRISDMCIKMEKYKELLAELAKAIQNRDESTPNKSLQETRS